LITPRRPGAYAAPGRLLGLLAHRYKARRSRYLGTRKARLQAAWTAALVKLNPIARQLTLQIA